MNKEAQRTLAVTVNAVMHHYKLTEFDILLMLHKEVGYYRKKLSTKMEERHDK